MRDKILWSKWAGMKQRCSNPKEISYKYYGGRGITVCDEWKDSYEAFRKWAMSNGYQKGLSLDRIDNDKGYSPENCRWVPLIEQKRNKRSAHLITINGETKFLTEWARIAGICPSTIYRRLNRGLSGEDLICKGPVIRLIGGENVQEIQDCGRKADEGSDDGRRSEGTDWITDFHRFKWLDDSTSALGNDLRTK